MATESDVYILLKLVNDRFEEVDLGAITKEMQYEEAMQVFANTKTTIKEFNETEFRKRFDASNITFETALKQWAIEFRSNEQIVAEYNRLLQL